MNEINITNGEEFNNYIKTKLNAKFIPFNEAMIDGNPIYPLFDEKFIQERCKTHRVTIRQYQDVLKEFIDFKNNMNRYTSINLWFGKELFCQLNLLTVLAYLEQEKYQGKIYLIIIDDNNKKIIKEKEEIILQHFINVYQNLFLNKRITKTNYYYLDKALKEYIKLNQDNPIIQYIRDNSLKLDKKKLFENVWDMTREYGFGDIQVKNYIEKHSNIKY